MQDAPDPRGADTQVVVAGQVHGDLLRPEVVLPAQPEDLLDHFRVRFSRLVVRDTGSVLEPLEALFLVAPSPLVVHLPTDAVIAAGRGDITADLFNMAQHGKLVFRPPTCQPCRSVLDL